MACLQPKRWDVTVALEKFERTVNLGSDMERCWSVLTDVEELVSWVEVLHSAREVERLRSYTAVLESRVGPFNLRADLSISVDVIEDGTVVAVRANGRDRAINSQIEIEGQLRLAPLPDGGTSLSVSGKYQVTGRATSLGAGIARKKGDAAVNQYVTGAERTLGSADSR
jgi:carbon monoxide dehydrogenase subunit G